MGGPKRRRKRNATHRRLRNLGSEKQGPSTPTFNHLSTLALLPGAAFSTPHPRYPTGKQEKKPPPSGFVRATDRIRRVPPCEVACAARACFEKHRSRDGWGGGLSEFRDDVMTAYIHCTYRAAHVNDSHERTRARKPGGWRGCG